MHNSTRSSRTRRERVQDQRRRGRPLAVVLALSTLAAVAGCSSDPVDTAVPPSIVGRVTIPPLPPGTALSTIPLPDGYVAPDTRSVELTPVTNGSDEQPPSPAVPMTGGTSRIHGAITNSGGPVAGARVRIERFLDDQVGRLDLTAGPDGRYEAASLPGGRYRVRAWSAPGLTTTRPVVLFLPANRGDAPVDFDLEGFGTTDFRVSSANGSFQVGQAVSVFVSMSRQYVDDEGIVRSGATAGAAVTAQVGAGLQLADGSTTTAGDGTARFSVTCVEPGSLPVTVTIGDMNRTASVECIPVPPPTTTTTVAVPVPADVPVGTGGFTTSRPTVVIFPPGTYVAQGGEAAKCAVLYEVFVDGTWVAGAAGSTLNLNSPGRSMRAAQGSPECLYRRVS